MPEALVIPGLLSIDPLLWEGVGPAEIVRGPLAGKAALPELRDWKQEIWLLPRDIARKHGARTPEDRLDLSGCRRLRARVAEAALVLVDEAVATRATTAGDPAIFLAYHRVSGGGGLELHQDGDARGFSSDDFALFEQAAGDRRRQSTEDEEVDEDQDYETLGGPEQLYDRVLRALSDDRFSLYDVDIAMFLDGIPSAEVNGFEDELDEIEVHAANRKSRAQAILAALDSAEGDTVLLPGGYEAHRVHTPAFKLRNEGGLTVVGDDISVPAEDRWIAAAVQDFTPPARKARRERGLATIRAAHQGQRRLRWTLILGLSVLGALLWRFLSH